VACELVGVAGFEPAASSSRTQVPAGAASAAACAACDGPSVDVRCRPPLAVAIVTHFVTQSPCGQQTAAGLARSVYVSRGGLETSNAVHRVTRALLAWPPGPIVSRVIQGWC
jgi:hypothetical protein